MTHKEKMSKREAPEETSPDATTLPPLVSSVHDSEATQVLRAAQSVL